MNSIRETNQVRLSVAPDRGRALHEYQCLTSIAETEPLIPSRGGLNAQSQSFSNVVRTFRISPAATAEFTQFHGSKEAAILEVVTALAITPEQAKDVLDGLARDGFADFQVTDSGVVVYDFQDIRRLGDKSSARNILE